MTKKINFSCVPKVLRAEDTLITSTKYPQLLSQGLSTEQCNVCGSHSIPSETRQVGKTSNLHYFLLHSQTILSLRLSIIQNSTVWTSKSENCLGHSPQLWSLWTDANITENIFTRGTYVLSGAQLNPQPALQSTLQTSCPQVKQ